MAADAEIAARGIHSVQMEVVAKTAGVSCATAFRQKVWREHMQIADQPTNPWRSDLTSMG